MQETNVVVASHGAGVANLLFLRPGSVLVEVMPFGITASPFATLARLYGIVRLPLTAMPDDDVFRSCVTHFNTDGAATAGVLARWAAASTAFREGAGGRRAAGARLGHGPGGGCRHGRAECGAVRGVPAPHL
eukprot:TRINITY_DN8351_c0_g1_i1.p3 TRINITY_DN8351_c0_g1~~TRINITY_DN8351_c0_g1_i1.p3  ORF type:complete len:149 (+),score=40.27 TRINITY_DN8351_c0_g1_i1:53-448(+)